MSSYEEYADLGSTGFSGGGGEQTPPEEEFFHSVYVSGSDRKNHINIVEKSGKFQVRGVQYNLDEVNIIITHTKEILAKIKSAGGRDNIECFSFKEGGPPWYGTSKLANGESRVCPQTSAERAVNDFCNECRSQLLVSGVYCKPDGSPILTEENKPIFVFIRGKGMRYSNVSNYLGDLYNEEGLTPIFEPVTEQSQEFEKKVVNKSRFVTNLTKTTERSSYGSDVNIFVLNRGIELPANTVKSILQMSKKTIDKFNEKFDWSKSKQAMSYTKPEGVLSVDGEGEKTTEESPVESKSEASDEKVFSFDDINF